MNFSNVKRRADPAETSETGKKDWKGGGGWHQEVHICASKDIREGGPCRGWQRIPN